MVTREKEPRPLECRPQVQTPGRGSFSPVAIPYQAVKLAMYAQVLTSLQTFAEERHLYNLSKMLPFMCQH